MMQVGNADLRSLQKPNWVNPNIDVLKRACRGNGTELCLSLDVAAKFPTGEMATEILQLWTSVRLS